MYLTFHKPLIGLFLFSTLFFVDVAYLHAQQPVNHHLLKGVVTSQQHEPLAGATVQLSDDLAAVTDVNGIFTISNIPTGTYALRIRYLGFKPYVKEIAIQSDSMLVISLEVDETLLNELMVTAVKDSLTESIRSITVLNKQELDKRRGQTIGQMLQSLPGVTTMTTGPAVSKPVIRGLHSQRIALINHGVTQEGQQWGSDHAPEIDPFSPDRLEVIRGAAGVEYGIGAIGGVIRVDTDPINRSDIIDGTVSLNGYTNNNQGAGSLRLEGGLGSSKKIGWRIQTSYRNASDSESPRDVIRNSGFRENDVATTINYTHKKITHDLHYSHFSTNLGIFRGAHIGNVSDLERAIELGRPTVDFQSSRGIDNPRQEISHDLLRYEGILKTKNNHSIQLNVGWQENRRKEFDLHRTFSNDPSVLDDPAFDLELTTWTADLKLKHTVTSSGLWGSVGITSMKQANVRQTAGSLIPNFSSWTVGAFALENWSSDSDKVTLEAGLRADVHWREVFTVEDRSVIENNFTYFSPSFVGGVTYKFTDTWSVSGTISTAWRPPGVNEQFSDGVHHGTARFEQGNLDLDPERSFNTDVTLRHNGRRTYWQFSAYNNIIDNYIFLEPGDAPVLSIRGSFPFFNYEQIKARISGFESLFEYQFSRQFKTGSSISLLRGWDRTRETPLIFMPSDRFNLFTHYDLPNGGNKIFTDRYLELRGTIVRRQTHFPKGVDFAPPPDGYKLLDIEAGTKVDLGNRDITLSIVVSNVLNSSYRDYLSRFRYFIDDPGRNVILRAQVPLK